MKELVEAIAKALVDHPENVQVKSVDGEQVTVLELRVHPDDLGKVIGRQGRTAKSMRTILGAAGMKLRQAPHAGNPRIEWPQNRSPALPWREFCARADCAAKSPPKSSLIFPERLPNLREVWLADGRSAPRRISVRALLAFDEQGRPGDFPFCGRRHAWKPRKNCAEPKSRCRSISARSSAPGSTTSAI